MLLATLKIELLPGQSGSSRIRGWQPTEAHWTEGFALARLLLRHGRRLGLSELLSSFVLIFEILQGTTELPRGETLALCSVLSLRTCTFHITLHPEKVRLVKEEAF